MRAWLGTHKQLAGQDESVLMHIEQSPSDRFFISLKHNLLFLILYTVLVFPKKETKRTRKGNKETMCLDSHAERKSYHHIEIISLLKILKLLHIQKSSSGKNHISLVKNFT